MVRPAIESRERFSGCSIGSLGHEWKRGLHSLRPNAPHKPQDEAVPFFAVLVVPRLAANRRRADVPFPYRHPAELNRRFCSGPGKEDLGNDDYARAAKGAMLTA